MKHFKTIEEYPKDFQYINEFYILIKGFSNMDYENRHNPFYFYLDFIGYTKNRTNGIAYDLLPYRAIECFGHLERCSFMMALKVFENYSYISMPILNYIVHKFHKKSEKIQIIFEFHPFF